MRSLLIIVVLGATLFSCKKRKDYYKFTDKELVFVNYTKGQNLTFIDTADVVRTLVQNMYRRDFREHIGLWGRTGAYTEEYEVSYYAPQNGDIDIWIRMNAPQLQISCASYEAWPIPDSISYTFPSLIINGKSYNEVYTLKMIKDGRYATNKNDTATLFHNKEFGVLQLLYPNGKKIMRVD